MKFMTYSTSTGLTDGPELTGVDEWADGETEDSYLARLGYLEETIRDGDPEAFSITVYEGTAATRPKYMVVISDGYDRSDYAFCEGTAAMTMLRAQLSPLVTAATLTDYLNELATMAKHAFRAHHGHSHERVCSRCDPTGFEVQEAADQIRRERRAAEAAAERTKA